MESPSWDVLAPIIVALIALVPIVLGRRKLNAQGEQLTQIHVLVNDRMHKVTAELEAQRAYQRELSAAIVAMGGVVPEPSQPLAGELPKGLHVVTPFPPTDPAPPEGQE